MVLQEELSLCDFTESNRFIFFKCVLLPKVHKIFVYTNIAYFPMQSQSHGKLVRRLSKRLKVGSRVRTHQSSSSSNHSEFLSVRPHSPVLVSNNPVPLHMQSLLEEEGESSSSLNTSSASSEPLPDWQ